MEQTNTADRELRLSRLLDAPIDLVWEVWTSPDHLKNWWGPTGFTNTISKMEVSPDGDWDLVMHGPDGTDYKNKSVFKEIVKHEKIVYEHISGPKFLATILFEKKGDKTFLQWHMLFNTREEFIQTVKTFKADEGLKQNIEKLNVYLEAAFTIRQQLKKSTVARVTHYLNFPGTTEEAMNFYKTVFNGKFVGKGIQRLGDAPPHEGMPQLSEADKKLILHIELELFGGYIIMATDAPESMGFTLTSGNNMHISVEPESKAETTRIFEALAEGGNITMPLVDMFFGAYYGSLTDRYGINWMVNFAEPKK